MEREKARMYRAYQHSYDRCASIVGLRGAHSDKNSWVVRPTAEPRPKFIGLSYRKPSRAELVRLSEKCSARISARLPSTFSDNFGQSDSRIPQSPRTKIIHYQSFLIKIYLSTAQYSISFYKSFNFQSNFMKEQYLVQNLSQNFRLIARLGFVRAVRTSRVSEITTNQPRRAECPK